MKLTPVRRLLLLSLALALLPGCSVLLHRKKALAPKKTTPPAVVRSSDTFTGQWAGTWHSDATNHGGKLRCHLAKLDDTHYEARFTAFWAALHSSYTVKLKAERRDDILHIGGRKDLGKMLGGMYEYQGTVTHDAFDSTYTSKLDHGTFALHRGTE